MITHLGLDYDYFEMGIQMQNNETNESPENLTLPNQEDIEKPILNPIVPASGSAGIIFEQNSEVLPVARHKSYARIARRIHKINFSPGRNVKHAIF